MPGKRHSEARRWYQQASHDLRAVDWNIQGGFYSTACFLAQQAGEKALKSLLYYLGASRVVLHSHSLVEMLQEAVRKVAPLGTLLEKARELDLHYIPSRYPNGLPSGYPHQFYGLETAQRALAAAQDIVGAVREHYREHREAEILDG